MAVRYATKTGVWSDITVWDGGTTLPEAGDDVYSNTFIVTIDQEITVLSLNNGAETGITQGGYFVTTDGNTINADINHRSTASSSYVLRTTGMLSGQSVIINGNVTNLCVAGAVTFGFYITDSNITVTINGNVTGAVSSTAGNGISFSGGISSTLNINGNVYGGNRGNTTYANSSGIVCGTSAGSPVINVTGNVYGGGGAAPTSYTGSHGIYMVSVTGNAEINITGNVYGGNATVSALSSGIYLSGCTNTTVNLLSGNIYGAEGTTLGYGIYVLGTSTNTVVNVNATGIYGSSTSTAAGYALNALNALSCSITANELICNSGSGIYVRNATVNIPIVSGPTTATGTAIVTTGDVCDVTITTATGYGGNVFQCLTGIHNITVTNPVLVYTSGIGNVIYAVTAESVVNFVGTIDDRNNVTDADLSGAVLLNLGATVNITGDVYAGRRNGIRIGTLSSGTATTLGTLNITGNVYAGVTNTTGFACCGIYVSGASAGNKAVVNVYGRVEANAGSLHHGLFAAATMTLPHEIFLQIVKANNYPLSATAGYGVIASTGCPVTLTAMEFGEAGLVPLGGVGKWYFQETASNYVIARASESGPIVSMGDIPADYPAVNNVRDAVPFNFGSQIGTCKVPNPASVAVGVPVDHAVGTSALNPEDVWNVITAGLNTPNSIGERLKNAATVDTVGAQLAALL
jgi:hypothetical protein